MTNKGVTIVRFKCIMVDNTQANQDAVRKIYWNGDPIVSMEYHKHICLFYSSVNLDEIAQKHINHLWKSNINHYARITRTQPQWRMLKQIIISFIHNSCLQGLP